jgi:hypothetical protein
MNKLLQVTAGGATAMLLGAGLTLFWHNAYRGQGHTAGNTAIETQHEADIYAEVERLRSELASLKQASPQADHVVIGDEYNQALAELRQGMAALSEEMEALLTQRDGVAVAGAADEMPALSMEDELQPHEQTDWQQAQRMTRMEDHFQLETEYTGWSTTTTQTVRDAFGSEQLAALSLNDVSCRETLCRVEIHAADRMELEEMELWLPMKVGEQLPRATMQQTENADGSFSVVMFLEQEGHTDQGS